MVADFQPKISIIIPVYNGEKYVKEAIESALNQDYKNIEVIVVNDGSTDSTEKIVLNFKDKIRYFKKENGGVSSALNVGIQNMIGDYFSWLSHDDVYLPHKISSQVRFLEKLNDKNVVLFSNYKLMNEKSIITNDCVRLDHNLIEHKPYYSLLRGSVNGITILVPKTAFESVGYFDESLYCTQDYDLWYKMLKTYRFIHMDETLAVTRVHTSQNTSSNPKVISEGNKLWISMIKDLNDETKVEYEKTLYSFYKNMAIFLETTPYKEAKQFCQDQALSIESQTKLNHENYSVSVIIPFFNRFDLLKNAIDSVLRQSHQNFEIVCVNDGSTDDITPIVDFYKKNTRIRFINLEKNLGPSFARNRGIQESSGDFIAFLDSDDEFDERKIEIQLSMMKLYDAKISNTSYYRNDNKTKSLFDFILNTRYFKPTIKYCLTIATPTVMIDSSLLKQNNIRYDTNLKIGEDICFYLDILKIEPNLLGIAEPLSIVNVSSMSSSLNKEKQLIGIKNILRYILSDEYYFNHDNDISVLALDFCSVYGINLGINGIVPDYESTISWRITKPLRVIRTFIVKVKRKLQRFIRKTVI